MRTMKEIRRRHILVPTTYAVVAVAGVVGCQRAISYVEKRQHAIDFNDI